MMFKKVLFVFLFVSFFTKTYSQSFEKEYKLIKSEGELPVEFTLTSSHLVQKELLNRNSKQSKQVRKLNEKLIIFTQFDLNELFQSGYILINDTISTYVNKVANIVIEHQPELAGKLKIYVAKSTEVNAYCFENGTIFVNIGLIARLENEAQLAYILSHEFTHYIKKHSLNRIVEFRKIDKANNRKNGYKDKTLLKFQYSKENETEADTFGLSIFRKTGYELKQSVASLKLLQFSDLPFDSLTFDRTYFGGQNYELPEIFFLKHYTPINLEEKGDDAFKTHPNIVKRQKIVDELIVDPGLGGKEYIVSEASFKYIREIARFECCRMFLVERDYTDAFKWAYLLEKKYPNNIYLKKTIAKSLYAIMLNKLGDLKYDEYSFNSIAIPDYTKIEGSSQQVNYFLDKIPTKDLGILTMRLFWKNHVQFPEDKWFLNTSDTIMNLLFRKRLISSSEFNLTDFTNSTSNSYYALAYNDFFKNDDFRKMYELYSKKEIDTANSSTVVGLSKFDFDSSSKKNANKNAKNIMPNLNLKKVLIINPSYVYKVNDSYDVDHLLIAEKNEQNLIGFLKKNLSNLSIDYELINPSILKITDIAGYNEYGDINFWITERIDAGVENINPIFGTENIAEITQNHNAKYGLLADVKSEKMENPKGEKLMILYAWGWLVFPIPILVYQMIVPPKHIEFNISLIDLESGKVLKTKLYLGEFRNPNRHVKRFTRRFIKRLAQ